VSTAEFDLVVRGGHVYDGTGAPGRRADVAVKDGLIVAVGEVAGTGGEEIDATGKVVTPGFVDIHTHYDGQAVWDDVIAPTSWHGVTTAVMGNCGVGFAPCRPEHRVGLVELMEGVEDIPAPVMHQGLTWTWETFEEYLDVLDQTPRDIDLCALVPHAPLRVYVMGERALKLAPANAADIEQMRDIVANAIRAGAFGVSSSRSTSHQSLKGEYTPALLAREREIVGIMNGIADAKFGLFQFVAEVIDPEVLGDYQMVARALEKTSVRGAYSLLQGREEPELWREIMRFTDQAIEDGIDLRPVVAPRAVGLLMGLEGSQHVFAGTATYQTIADLPLAERVAKMKDPEIRQQILSEDYMEFSTWPLLGRMKFSDMFRFGNPPNYVPDAQSSVQAIADREGRAATEVAYDILLEDEGMGFIHVPFSNFASGDLRVCEEMLANPNAIMGLGDGGAHVGFILDAGFPTWLLTYWVKEKGTLELAEAIRRLTSDTADEMGLTDRGRIREGLRADLNVINIDRLSFGAPYVAYDLPAGGKRLLQKADGYDATILAGQITYRNGEQTGARPGRLVRSRSTAPATTA
jgi:N-acyl-D-aspartate/D-glutamate deacylase